MARSLCVLVCLLLGCHNSLPAAGSGGTSGRSSAGGAASGVGGVAAGSGGATSTGAAGVAGASGGPSAGATAPSEAGRGVAAGSGGGAGAPSTCTGTLPLGDTTKQLEFQGLTRSYIVHVPKQYDGKTALPLVVDLHPIQENATYQHDSSGYLQKADEAGFIVVFPNGIDNAWNVGPCCTRDRQVDDVGFVREVVASIQKGGCVDERRIYAAGFSNGGGLTHYLACHAADLFAAMAPSGFDLLEENVADCHPSLWIPIMSTRGTADPSAHYEGGPSQPPNGLDVTIHFLGARATFEKWAELNHCSDVAPQAKDRDGCEYYKHCSGDVEVGLCTVQGGGHDTGDADLGWKFLSRFVAPERSAL